MARRRSSGPRIRGSSGSCRPGELHVFYTPQTEEIAWASGQVRSDNHLLALMVQLKYFNRMGYFPRLDDVPDAVAHIRRDLGLGEDVAAVYDSDRTGAIIGC
ncbi:DUF4158 domain-containing protein [Streptomyces sp. AC555_RSS877]|uniref:DUF4158 domain-containing protein n=1 Tax=Streptomyces sp. AC555_RSS877 TaxID=2823688 RepID=UPI0027E4A1BC|nr:DUF4158 domain-containing protein [Streptomyces sp. AC555_RSS877]